MKQITKKVKLNKLIGGDASSLIVAFRIAARRDGWTTEEIDAVTKEAKSGDYDHLLTTLISYTH